MNTKAIRYFLVAVGWIIGWICTASAQQIQNTDFTQLGPEIHVSYDLLGEAQAAGYTITLHYSTNGGATFSGPLRAVSGDVGRVTPGTGKRIVWRMTEDVPQILSDAVVMRVQAEVKQLFALPEMVPIPAGSFAMGSEEGESDEKPIHQVRISAFQMGKYEVTVAQFKAFIDATSYRTDAETGDGSYIWTGSAWEKKAGINWRHDELGNRRPESEYNYPVIHVSHNDAMAYINWLNRASGSSGWRLPTEAEWEYAAGNGSRHTKYSWGNGHPSGRNGGNVSDEAAKKRYSNWTIFEGYNDGYVYTAPVGQYAPNDFGLYDVTGNVWEWCSDWYDSGYYLTCKSQGSLTDPQGPKPSSVRVLRGGSWLNEPAFCRVAFRSRYTPDNRYSFIGFRLARTL